MKAISIVSAIWGTVFFFIGGKLTDSNSLSSLLFGIPLLGLPMLLYSIHMASKNGAKFTVTDAIGMIVGGALWTLLCTVPVFIVILIFVFIFRR
jgi:hypothetical protein